MPLVLFAAERTAGNKHHWNDTVGTVHHFPNQYLSKVMPGERFVYYRGVRRADGKRGTPEYFGTGVIGEVWPDVERNKPETPKARWAYYCSIEDYEAFPQAVPRKVNGLFFEDIPDNHWGVGVRKIDDDRFGAILGAAGWSLRLAEDGVSSLPEPPLKLPIETTTSLLVERPKATVTGSTSTVGGRPTHRSKRSKLIGDRSEGIALQFIQHSIAGAHDVEHVAAKGEKPGWDIQYRDAEGRLQRVEVKGTTLKSFSCIELTARELIAAKTWGQEYWIYLVADCFNAPVLERICNPASKLLTDWWEEPIAYRIWRGS